MAAWPLLASFFKVGAGDGRPVGGCLFAAGTATVFAAAMGSLAFGAGGLAFGVGAVSFGVGCAAVGTSDLAFGVGAVAGGAGGFAFDAGGFAFGAGAFAFGAGAFAFGAGAFAFGAGGLPSVARLATGEGRDIGGESADGSAARGAANVFAADEDNGVGRPPRTDQSSAGGAFIKRGGA